MPDRVVIWRALADFSKVRTESAKTQASLASLQRQVDENNASNAALGASSTSMASKVDAANSKVATSVERVEDAQNDVAKATNDATKAYNNNNVASAKAAVLAAAAQKAKIAEAGATQKVDAAVNKLTAAKEDATAASKRAEIAEQAYNQTLAKSGATVDEIEKAETKLAAARASSVKAARAEQSASEDLQKVQLKQASVIAQNQLAAAKADAAAVRGSDQTSAALARQVAQNDKLRESIERVAAAQKAAASTTGSTLAGIPDTSASRTAIEQNTSLTQKQTAAANSLTRAEDALTASRARYTSTLASLNVNEQKLASVRATQEAATNAVAKAESDLERVRATEGESSLAAAVAENALLKAHQDLASAENDVVRTDRAVTSSHNALAEATASVKSTTDRLAASIVNVDREFKTSTDDGGTFNRVLGVLASGFGDGEGAAKSFASALGLLKLPIIAGGIYEAVVAVSALVDGLFELASAIGPAIGGLAAIGPAVVGLGTAFGTVKAAFSGVSAAVKAYSTQQSAAASGSTKSANTQINNAEAIKNAQQAVVQAQQQVGVTAQQGADSIASASHSIIQAQQAELSAQQSLNQARVDALANIMQLKQAVTDSALAERGAALDLKQAQEELQETKNDPTATRLQRQQAELAVANAKNALKQSKQTSTASKKSSDEASTAGVNGAQNVVQAKQQLAEATYNTADAEHKYAEAVQSAARQNQQALLAVKKAVQAVGTAERSSSDSGTAASNAYQTALNNLSPAAQKFTKYLVSIKSKWTDLKNVASANMLPGVQKGLESLMKLFPMVKSAVAGMATVLGGLATKFGNVMSSGGNMKALNTLLKGGQVIVKNLGNAVISLVSAFTKVFAAATPMAKGFSKDIENAAKRFETFADSAKGQDKMKAFFQRSVTVIHQLGQVIKNVTDGIMGLGRAANPAGNSLLQSMVTVTKKWSDGINKITEQKKLVNFFNGVRDNLKVIDHYIGIVAKGFLGMGNNKSLQPILKALGNLGHALMNLFGGGNGGAGAAQIINNIADAINGLAGHTSTLTVFLKILEPLTKTLGWVLNLKGVAPILSAIAAALIGFKLINLAAQVSGISQLSRGILSFRKAAGAAGEAGAGTGGKIAAGIGSTQIGSKEYKSGAKNKLGKTADAVSGFRKRRAAKKSGSTSPEDENTTEEGSTENVPAEEEVSAEEQVVSRPMPTSARTAIGKAALLAAEERQAAIAEEEAAAEEEVAHRPMPGPGSAAGAAEEEIGGAAPNVEEAATEGGAVMYHGGLPAGSTPEDIDVNRSGTQQGKGGKYGGFYATDESSKSWSEDYAKQRNGVMHRIEMKPEARQGDLGDRNIDRLSHTERAALSEQYDYVSGKDTLGRSQHVILNPDAIAKMEESNLNEPDISGFPKSEMSQEEKENRAALEEDRRQHPRPDYPGEGPRARFVSDGPIRIPQNTSELDDLDDATQGLIGGTDEKLRGEDEGTKSTRRSRVAGAFRKRWSQMRGNGDDTGAIRFGGGGPAEGEDEEEEGSARPSMRSRLGGMLGMGGGAAEEGEEGEEEGGSRLGGMAGGLAGGAAMAGIAIGGTMLGGMINDHRGGARQAVGGAISGAAQGAAMGAMAGPEGLVAGAVIGGAIGLFQNSKIGATIKTWFSKDVWPMLKRFPSDVVQWGKDVLNGIEWPFKEIQAVAGKYIDPFIKVVEVLFGAITTYFKDTFDFWETIFEAVFDIIKDIFTGNFGDIWKQIQRIFGAIGVYFKQTLDFIGKLFVAAWDYIKASVEVPINLIWLFLKKIWDGVLDFIKLNLDAIKLEFQLAWLAIKDLIVNPITDAISALKLAWTEVSSWLTTKFQALHDAASAIFSKIGSVISGAFSDAGSAISTAWNAIEKTLADAVNFVTQKILNPLIGAVNSVITKFGISGIGKLGKVNWGGASGGTATGGGDPNQAEHGGVFAKGGVLPGYTPGRDPHEFTSNTGLKINLSGGEGILVPEATRALGGKAAIDNINRTYSSRLPSAKSGGHNFALGGLVPNPISEIGKAAKSVARGVTGGVESLGGDITGVWSKLRGAGAWATKKSLEAAESPLIALLDKLPIPLFQELSKGIFNTVNNAAYNFVAGKRNDSGSKGGGPVPQGEHASLIKQALGIAKVSDTKDAQEAVNIIIGGEDGSWNPSAVNKSDINWQEGHPSVGLMQVIAGTFKEWVPKELANKGPFEYGVSEDPIANMTAGIRYAVGRYGNLDAVPGVEAVRHGEPYVGYRDGGVVQNFHDGGVVKGKTNSKGVPSGLGSSADNGAISALMAQAGISFPRGAAHWDDKLNKVFKNRLAGVNEATGITHGNLLPHAEGWLDGSTHITKGMMRWIDKNDPKSYDDLWKKQPYGESNIYNNSTHRNPLEPILSYVGDMKGWKNYRKVKDANYWDNLTARANGAAPKGETKEPGVAGPKSKTSPNVISKVQNWLRSTVNNKPYKEGTAGPNSYDCSGLVGEVWNRLTDNTHYKREFSTFDEGERKFFAPGKGTNADYVVGYSDDSTEHHTAGDLAGLRFEARDTAQGILVGNSARTPGSFEHTMHLPNDRIKGLKGGHGDLSAIPGQTGKSKKKMTVEQEKKNHAKTLANQKRKESQWAKEVAMLGSATSDEKTHVSSLRRYLGISGSGGNAGLFSDNMTQPVDHIAAHELGISHPADWAHPWSGPVTETEKAIAQQEYSNKLNAEWYAALQTLADWGLSALVDNLMNQGESGSTLTLAKSAAADKKEAIQLNQAILNGQTNGGGLSTDDQNTIIRVIGKLGSGSSANPFGLRDITSYLNVPDYTVVDLFDDMTKQLAKLPASLTKKFEADVASFRQGTFYANTGRIVPGVGNTDSVDARLTPGEGVIKKSAMERLGHANFHRINNGEMPQFFANGGIAFAPNISSPTVYTGGSASARSLVARSGPVAPVYHTELNTTINNPTGEASISSINRNLRKQAALNLIPMGSN